MVFQDARHISPTQKISPSEVKPCPPPLCSNQKKRTGLSLNQCRWLYMKMNKQINKQTNKQNKAKHPNLGGKR